MFFLKINIDMIIFEKEEQIWFFYPSNINVSGFNLAFSDIGLPLTRCQYSAQLHFIWAEILYKRSELCWIFHFLKLSLGWKRLRYNMHLASGPWKPTLSILWHVVEHITSLLADLLDSSRNWMDLFTEISSLPGQV